MTNKTEVYFYLTPKTARAWRKISIDAGLPQHKTLELLLHKAIPEKFFSGDVPEYKGLPTMEAGRSLRTHSKISNELHDAMVRLAVAGRTNTSEVAERCLVKAIPPWYFTDPIDLGGEKDEG